MKVELENIKLGHSSITDRIFAGITNKKGDKWLNKQDVTDTFIGAVISRWENQTETIVSGKDEWQITVKKLKS
jgi:hypothetical protein